MKKLVGGLLLASVAFAHEAEGIQPPSWVSALWAVHSWTHWLVWMGFIYTCYYFRFVAGRLAGDSPACVPIMQMKKEKAYAAYAPESGIQQYGHGPLVWIMAIWTAIHLSELIGGLLGYAEQPVYSLGEFIPGEEILEWVYIATTIALLASCHHLRYLGGGGKRCLSCQGTGRQQKMLFGFQSFWNAYHGHFFWLAIAAGVLVLLSGGHL